jgi:glycogen phosphorylase
VYAGDLDIVRAIDELASSLPPSLVPLARVAFDYRWSWALDGHATFAAIDPDRWLRCGQNPYRLLTEAPRSTLLRAAADPRFVMRAERLAGELDGDRHRAWDETVVSREHPVAFCCAEFGVHGSLPIYSGGLGVLAGDILKEASDLALPLVGVGLMYRTGYFHQRIDLSGYQHEYWLDSDPDRLPAVRVTNARGEVVTVTVPVDDEDVVAQVWRVDVGRVPLYLLDTDLPENSAVGRWVTSRLYEGSRPIRLAQYALLGVGGLRALQAMGIEPAVHHFNEGHPALGAFELLARARADGDTDPWARVREQVVFTTHTPVWAGNETYHRDEVLSMLGRFADTTGDREEFLGMGRFQPGDHDEPSGLSALALRASRHANGVSRRHGEVARRMWQPLFGDVAEADVPITHITNGVHVPTWMQGELRALLDERLGAGWLTRADDPATWAPVADIPDADLWAARCSARRELVRLIRHRAASDRLRRGESLQYAEATTGFDPDRLTVGFARRLATYKRLHLLSRDPGRALALLGGDRGLQFVFAGKAHPNDGEAKDIVRQLFTLKGAPDVAGHTAFLEDYEIPLAGHLVAGCDVWVNLPRPPLEASGTSGMKSVLGGGLQLSVLDGWWAEAYDGTNGWAIDGDEDADQGAQDDRDTRALFDLLEREVVPMFNERDDDGIPHRWVEMIRRSLLTNGPQFSANRMVREYAARAYRPT